jgi:U4/U6.U5 tri-snRNP-associated protein 2
LFKCHCSPHELVAAISKESKKKFQSTKRSDPMEFFIWLLNSLERSLKSKRNIVGDFFRGHVRILTEPVEQSEDDVFAPQRTDVVTPFLFLVLDLPMTPLFQDQIEKNIIPQVSMQSLLEKYDWKTYTVRISRKTYLRKVLIQEKDILL